MRGFLLALLMLAVAVAGCSGDSGDPAGGGDDDGGAPGATAGGQGGGSTPPGTTSAGSTAPADYDVELYDNRYDPTALVVPNYQKVFFVNKGTLSHTVTIVKQGDPPGSFLRDQPIQPGSSVDFNFPNDGTYNVYCRYHGSETSGMHMTITV